MTPLTETSVIHPVPKPQPREKSPRRPLPRSTTPIARSGRPNRKNRKRSAENFDRSYGDYAAWIRSLPCLITGRTTGIEASHVRTGGMGRRADARWLVPLAGPYTTYPVVDGLTRFVNEEGPHRELHRIGQRSFEQRHSVDLRSVAARLYAEFQTLAAEAPR